MTQSNPKVLVREPPEYPRIGEFRRGDMTSVTLRTHGPRGFSDRRVDVPSRLPDVVRVEGDGVDRPERLYVRGSRLDGKWSEANVWPILEDVLA